MIGPAHWRSWRPLLGAAALLGVVATAALPSPVAAAEPEAGRILIFSVPSLTWVDLEDGDLPNIEAFLADAAVAALAPRSVRSDARPGDAYLTISAGTRTITPDDDGQILAVEAPYDATTAAAVFERRTGIAPDGAYVVLPWPAVERANDAEPYDAVPGLLADTLEEAGVPVAAIGNADGSDTGLVAYGRHVGLALADTDGVVAGGDLSRDLLVEDGEAPFGTRLDIDAVTAAFGTAWASDRTAVVVEGSDLARVARYRSFVDGARYRQLRATALSATDDLFARLLADVDRSRDAVLVVAPYHQNGARSLTVAALQTPDGEAGYLRTATTQRAGVVSLVDVAPTILATLGVARPTEMEGRPFEMVASGTSLQEREDHLVALNAASLFREDLLTPTTIAVVMTLASVVAATIAVVAGNRQGRLRGAVAFAALAVLAMLPMSFLARAFPLQELGLGFYWSFLVGGSVALAAASTVVARRAGDAVLGLVSVLVVMLGVLVVDVMSGSDLHLSSAFGYSPTGNSRLYGISNYSFGQLAMSACLLAALVAWRWPSRRGRIAAVGLLIAVLVVDGLPTWGSDVGGILAFTPAVLLFALLVRGRPLPLRLAVPVAGLTVAAVVAFGFADLARPPEQRAHLGRLFERIGDEGLEPLLSIMSRKLVANLEVSTSSFWVAAIPIALALWLFLSRWPGSPWTSVVTRIPTLRIASACGLVSAILGSLVNDSGIIVGGVTLLVLAASMAYLVTAEARPGPIRSARAGERYGGLP